MGLYKKAWFSFSDLDWEKLKTPILAFLVLIGLIIALSLLASVLQPRALNVSLGENPLVLTEGGKNFTVLTVVVTNTTGRDALNVPVVVEALDPNSILIDVDERKEITIPILGDGESRAPTFIVRVNPSREILPGNYKIAVSTEINGKAFVEEITLQIQKQS